MTFAKDFETWKGFSVGAKEGIKESKTLKSIFLKFVSILIDLRKKKPTTNDEDRLKTTLSPTYAHSGT